MGSEPIGPGRRWAVVVLLCLAFMIAYFDRINLSISLAQEEFKQFFKLTDQTRGWLNSAFFWTYAALQIPAGWLVDRAGSKVPFAVGFLLWSLFSACTAWADVFWQLFLLRMLLGVGESVVIPAGMSWIRFNFGEDRRGLVMGIYNAAGKLGPAVGAVLATWLLEARGWRGMFLIMGLGSLLWLVPWLAVVPKDPPRPRPPRKSDAPAGPGAFERALMSPAIWGILIATFAYNYFVYFSLTWLPSVLVERLGLSLKRAGDFVSFAFGGMAVVAIAAGWVSDLLIGRGGHPVRVRKAFAMAGLILASSVALGVLTRSRGVSLALVVLSASGLGLTTGSYWALTQSMVPGSIAGRVAGLQNFASNVSGIVASLVTGYLKASTRGYEVPILVVGLTLAAGASAYHFLVREDSALITEDVKLA